AVAVGGGREAAGRVAGLRRGWIQIHIPGDGDVAHAVAVKGARQLPGDQGPQGRGLQGGVGTAEADDLVGQAPAAIAAPLKGKIAQKQPQHDATGAVADQG
ncbi:MAG: hypothetical protein ACK559_01400, partial [bacterium]